MTNRASALNWATWTALMSGFAPTFLACLPQEICRFVTLAKLVCGAACQQVWRHFGRPGIHGLLANRQTGFVIFRKQGMYSANCTSAPGCLGSRSSASRKAARSARTRKRALLKSHLDQSLDMIGKLLKNRLESFKGEFTWRP